MTVLDSDTLARDSQQLGAILSQRRINSSETAVEVAVDQLQHLRALLPKQTRVLADRW